MADSSTFDLRAVECLDEEDVKSILKASRLGPVTVFLEPGSDPAQKLSRLLGGLLREARPGVWRLGA